MAKRRVKKRTHVGAPGTRQNAAAKQEDKGPKSMVIRIGASEVGPSVSQLVKDVRRMMEPGTAARLKERRTNRLRDYTNMCGPLGVTHLLLFSKSRSGNTNLRLAITPRGPTLHFRVQEYALCKDIEKSMKRPKGGSNVNFHTPPLLVMNNFTTPSGSATSAVPKHLEQLSTTIFQSIFPPISPQNTPLSSIRRVLLLNRETTTKSTSDESKEEAAYVLNLRHYAITTPLAKSSRADLPRPLRKLHQAGTDATHPKKGKPALPDLGKLTDVSEYLLDPAAAGYLSATSESDAETEAEVEVAAPVQRRVKNDRQREKIRGRREAEAAANQQNGDNADAKIGRRNAEGVQVEQRAVKLTELGPRMKLRLFKVEEGLCEGRIMWHQFVGKSREEVKRMDRDWEQRKREKAERKRIQKENVERKKKDKKSKGTEEDVEETDEEEWDDDDLEDWDDMDEDDVEGENVLEEEQDEDMEDAE